MARRVRRRGLGWWFVIRGLAPVLLVACSLWLQGCGSVLGPNPLGELLAENRELMPTLAEWRVRDEAELPITVVYGTRGSKEETEQLRSRARALVGGLRERWREKDVTLVTDAEATRADVTGCTLILIGGPWRNELSYRIARLLPFRQGRKRFVVAGEEFTGADVGVVFQRPNPFDPRGSLLLAAAVEAKAIVTEWVEQDLMVYRLREDRPGDYWQLAFGTWGDDYKLARLDLVDNTPTPTGEDDPIPPPEVIRSYPAPEWARRGVMYEVFVRSFCDSDGDGIGDLRGLRERLDYLNDGDPATDGDLGVDVLWLMPIFESPSYHGYDIADPLEIDPDYGTLADFQELARACHQRGIRLILDFVPNHLSSQSVPFRSAFLHPDSPYDGWFYFTNKSNTRCHHWYFRFSSLSRDVPVTTMPALNLGNPEAREFTMRVAEFWLDPDGDGDFSDGADGFRCDHAIGPPHAYWKLLRQRVKARRPDALLLAEAWADVPTIAEYFEDEFDMAFDFPFQGALLETILSGDNQPLVKHLKLARDSYPPQALLNRFINNHDMNRIASRLERGQIELAALVCFTLPGMPMIYYGDEIGMRGLKDPGDEGVRRPLKWGPTADAPGTASWYPILGEAHDGVSVAEQRDDPESLLSFYRRLIRLRRSRPALATGVPQGIKIDSRQALAYLVRGEGDAILVVGNLGEKKTLTLSLENVVPDAQLDRRRCLLSSLPERAPLPVRGERDHWLIDLETFGYRVWSLGDVPERDAFAGSRTRSEAPPPPRPTPRVERTRSGDLRL